MNQPFKSLLLLQCQLSEACMEVLYDCSMWVGLLPRGLEFYLFLVKHKLLSTLNYPPLCLNPLNPFLHTHRPRDYLYCRPSLSKPKTSWPSPKRHHHYWENSSSLLSLPSCTLPACFFFCSFFSFFCSFLCCLQLLLSTALKFSLRSRPSVPVRGKKVF